MSLKKQAKSKRTNLPRESEYTRRFLKDWKRLSNSGRYDMNRLKEVMLAIIANDGDLPPERLDHNLTGDWEGHRECHIGGDFLLVYMLDTRKNGMVVFSRCGTHAEIFG